MGFEFLTKRDINMRHVLAEKLDHSAKCVQHYQLLPARIHFLQRLTKKHQNLFPISSWRFSTVISTTLCWLTKASGNFLLETRESVCKTLQLSRYSRIFSSLTNHLKLLSGKKLKIPSWRFSTGISTTFS
jgi:hypothetical protein